MIPFLKNRNDAAASGPVETMERKSDDPPGFDMLDAVAEDLLTAFETKDKKLLREALESLCQHIADQDATQDQEPTE